MKNFLQETLSAIENLGQEPDDIIFIGSQKSGHECTWDEFKILADFDYDAEGYGHVYIPSDLIILFEFGGMLWRDDYDGSEFWARQPILKRPREKKRIHRLLIKYEYCGLKNLSDINKYEDEDYLKNIFDIVNS